MMRIGNPCLLLHYRQKMRMQVSDLDIHIQSLGFLEKYWLDSGAF